jgi:NAD(P)-dependent dehydrogenase (short-subunit alcohol dehydrogenase family)
VRSGGGTPTGGTIPETNGNAALITGASSGIGQAAAVELASDDSAHLVGECIEANGGMLID